MASFCSRPYLTQSLGWLAMLCICCPLLQCTTAGWSFPWGLRVRLYEMLLRALFDTLDEAEYVQDKDRCLQVLEVGN